MTKLEQKLQFRCVCCGKRVWLYPYEIPNADDVNLLDGKNKCYGICYYTKQIIYIDKSLEINKLYRTLKHELTHAFIYCYLLKINCKYDEEELCEFVAIYGEKIINIATEYFNNRNKVSDINE